jgi:hypothetical protein
MQACVLLLSDYAGLLLAVVWLCRPASCCCLIMQACVLLLSDYAGLRLAVVWLCKPASCCCLIMQACVLLLSDYAGLRLAVVWLCRSASCCLCFPFWRPGFMHVFDVFVRSSRNMRWRRLMFHRCIFMRWFALITLEFKFRERIHTLKKPLQINVIHCSGNRI